MCHFGPAKILKAAILLLKTIKNTEGAACRRSLGVELIPAAAELRLQTALLFLGVWLLLDHV